MTRCPKSELPVEFCACCRAATTPLLVVLPPAVPSRRRAPRRPPREPGRYRLPAGVHAAGPQHAKARGVCIGCKEAYAAGAPVRHDAATGGWRAECCFGEAP